MSPSGEPVLVSHVLYTKNSHRGLYKESKHPTKSTKKLKIKDSKNHDLFLTMGVS